MMMRRQWLVGTLVAAAGVMAFLALTHEREPRHEGRTITEWMEDLGSEKYETRQAAEAALRAMGPAAVPHLTNSLAQRESLALRLYRQNPLPRPWVNWIRERTKLHAPVMESRSAAMALRSLGPDATEAIPALVAALGDASPLVADSAMGALGAIGSNAVPALTARLTAAPARELPWVIRALGGMGTNGAAAAPAVAEFLTSADSAAANNAVMALIQMRAPAAWQATNYLGSTNREVVNRALVVLHNLGPQSLWLTNPPSGSGGAEAR